MSAKAMTYGLVMTKLVGNSLHECESSDVWISDDLCPLYVREKKKNQGQLVGCSIKLWGVLLFLCGR